MVVVVVSGSVSVSGCVVLQVESGAFYQTVVEMVVVVVVVLGFSWESACD